MLPAGYALLPAGHALARTAPILNPVFTRVVNHCVIVVGLKGATPRREGRRGRVFSVREGRIPLQPNLHVEHDMSLGKKIYPVQYLRAIRPHMPQENAGIGIRFC